MEDKAQRINEIRNKIFEEKKLSLPINRVPEPTREAFIKFADDYFCGDRGQALKYVFDTAMRYGPMMEQVQAMLIEHEKRLAFLETPVELPEKKIIKMANGRIVELEK